MGLRCSLLGHDYGDVDVEREREERGSEVVLTVREYEECTHCGDRHVISENTEVRSISRGAGADPRSDEPASQPAPRSAEPPATNPDSDDAGVSTAKTDDDAAFIDADDVEFEPGSSPTRSNEGDSGVGAEATEAEAETELLDDDAPDTEPRGVGSEPHDPGAVDTGDGTPAEGPISNESDTGGAGIELPTDENGDPVTDDGEILEDDGTTVGDREYGEWPDSNDVGPPVESGTESESDDWPDRESEPLEDDAILLDTGTTSTASDTEPEPTAEGAAGGPPAAEAKEATADAEPETEPDPGSGIERASEAPTPGSEGGIPGGDGQATLHCPRCGFTAGSDRSSLRTGDICPECRMGYLGVQPDR